MADDFFLTLGIHVQDMFAGFAGGVVNAFVFRKSDPWSIIGSMVVGAFTAGYLAESVSLLLHLSSGPAGFVVGIAGMAICQGIVTAAQAWRPNIPGAK